MLKNFKLELDRKVDDWRIMVGHLQAAVDRRLVAAGDWLRLVSDVSDGAVPRGRRQDRPRLTSTATWKSELTLAAAARLGSHLETIATASSRRVGRAANAAPRGWSEIAPGFNIGAASGGIIDYRPPTDAQQTGLPVGSVDCVFSNSVLEHVPPLVIEGIFREAWHPGAQGRHVPLGELW